MRIGVLSDTHLTDPSQPLPQEMLADFENVDRIIHAGDWVDRCVYEQLKPLAEIIGIQGNMDHANIRNTFPEIIELDLSGYNIGLTHGWGPPRGIEERILRKFPKTPDIIIYGHTHQAVFHKKNDLYYFNPGSPTDTLTASRCTYGILTLGSDIQGEIIPLP